jgi:NitT/TauT family transport system ATP-binding protein
VALFLDNSSGSMDPARDQVRLEHVDKRFPGGLVALQDVNLHVAPGEFVALVGPSGCGKSTVLRLVAGLDTPTEGRVEAPAVSDASVAATAFVFQEPTLMPWASVFDNVWLPLRLAGVTRGQASGPVRELLAGMGLGDFEGAYPAELSGGMRMRASIARALVTRPQLLLMDEPFAALDENTRGRLNAELLAWWAARSLAVLFVTHNVLEAVFLSQRVIIMSARPGHVVAEVAIAEPYPRKTAFRASVMFHDACTRVSAALEVA